jgi:hypothetical protein
MASFKRFRKVETGEWVLGRGSGFLAGEGDHGSLNGFGDRQGIGARGGSGGPVTTREDDDKEPIVLRVTGPSQFHRDV